MLKKTPVIKWNKYLRSLRMNPNIPLLTIDRNVLAEVGEMLGYSTVPESIAPIRGEKFH